MVFHVINRAIRKQQLFAQPCDYSAFVRSAVEAHSRFPVSVLAYCVMPNHFHFVIQPYEDHQLSKFMARLEATHAKRWHANRGTTGTGAVYQGRFRAFPVQTEDYFYRVCRYVEANALRAGLVRRAEDWPWSSIAIRPPGVPSIPIDRWPLPRPNDWVATVNDIPASHVQEVRLSIVRGRPLGEQAWAARVARDLGLGATLQHPGRPRNDL